MNKAVPIEKLKGAVFGEPLNPQYKEAESIVGKCLKMFLAPFGRFGSPVFSLPSFHVSSSLSVHLSVTFDIFRLPL